MPQILTVTKSDEKAEVNEVQIIIEPNQPPIYNGIEDFEANLTGTAHWSGWLDAKQDIESYCKPKESEFELTEIVEFLRDAGFDVAVNEGSSDKTES